MGYWQALEWKGVKSARTYFTNMCRKLHTVLAVTGLARKLLGPYMLMCVIFATTVPGPLLEGLAFAIAPMKRTLREKSIAVPSLKVAPADAGVLYATINRNQVNVVCDPSLIVNVAAAYSPGKHKACRTSTSGGKDALHSFARITNIWTMFKRLPDFVGGIHNNLRLAVNYMKGWEGTSVVNANRYLHVMFRIFGPFIAESGDREDERSLRFLHLGKLSPSDVSLKNAYCCEHSGEGRDRESSDVILFAPNPKALVPRFTPWGSGVVLGIACVVCIQFMTPFFMSEGSGRSALLAFSGGILCLIAVFILAYMNAVTWGNQ